MKITVEIDELVLRGIAPGQDGHELAESLERELQRLVAERGLAVAGDRDVHDLAPLMLKAAGNPAQLGRSLAQALYGRLGAELAGAPGEDSTK